MPRNPRVFIDIKIGNAETKRLVIELFADTNSVSAERFRLLCLADSEKLAILKIFPGMYLQGCNFNKAGDNAEDADFSRRHAGPGLLSVPASRRDQFLITFKKQADLDNVNEVIGQVASGMELLHDIERIPTDAGDKPRVTVKIVDSGEITKSQKHGNSNPTAEPEEEAEEDNLTDVPKSELELKLSALRLKMNQSRRLNNAAVINEQNKSSCKPKHDKDTDHKHSLLNEPAFIAEARATKKQRGEEGFGWNVFNPDTLYRAHEKRTAALGPNVDAYKKHLETTTAGILHKPSEIAKQRVAETMAKAAANRANFSRRREFNEDDDVNYISERNRHFNKKIERSFNTATSTIRSNIERGSAI